MWKMHWAVALAAYTSSIALLIFLVLELICYPNSYAVWCATALAMGLSIITWPPQLAQNPRALRAELEAEKTAMRAERLPYKSRLLVAQTTARRLQHRIRLIKGIQGARRQHQEILYQRALVASVQVLVKATKSDQPLNVNALTLAVLPIKLRNTVGIDTDLPQLLAALASARGTNTSSAWPILRKLFSELVPPLLKEQILGAPPSKSIPSGEPPDSNQQQQQQTTTQLFQYPPIEALRATLTPENSPSRGNHNSKNPKQPPPTPSFPMVEERLPERRPSVIAAMSDPLLLSSGGERAEF